ncbi:ATP-binding cassette domain-containing protein [bacterium]|nr:ATP-binding cassette domain-containing protein [bacterium]
MNTAAESIIEVKGLAKRFGKVIALDGISFSVKRGEIFGFLGPNGAGKTTTIRILTGIIVPDAGDASIAGIDIQRDPLNAKMRIGVIPELGNIYVDLTARENIILAGRFYGMFRHVLEKKADELLKRFEIYERRNDPLRSFSKGMKQRVNIASALVHDPEILFLDEPTSGLDVQSQRLIKGIIGEINRKGTTIFLTTHNIEEANVLCQRVGIINKGRIASIDTPESLKRTFEETRSVTCSFDMPADIALFEGNSLVNRLDRMGDKWRLYTDNPDELVKYLASRASEQGLSFTSLEICGASLEDAFLRLTQGGERHVS